MKTDYERKVERAIALLRAIPQDTEIELAYSTGKDSDVILQLAKEAGISFRAIYKNTTIDRVGSLKHAKEMGVEIINPKKTFFELVRENGMPSRFYRFCCKHLKEYKIYDRVIMGVRKAESSKRNARYNEPEQCRKLPKGGKIIAYYPILDWTNEDVERFIKERKLKCHPHYYDEEGNFHVGHRVGCIGCPLQHDRGKADFKKYPKFLKSLIRNIDIFIKEHPDSSSKNKFNNVYNMVFFSLFCNSYPEYQNFIGGGDFWR